MFTSKADGTTKDKNRGRGSGKTTLITAISLLYRGSVPIRSNSNQDRVTSDLLSTGALPIRILELDNLKSFKFSSEFFEWLITASEIGGHRMYEGFAKRPNYTTLLISANGPSLSKDVALRTVPVELKRPKYTAGWWTATRELIEGHRDEIFADVAKFLSRKPKPIKRLTRWEEWCSVVAARLSKPDDLISAIRSRAVKVDADDQAADEVIAYVASRIRAKAGYPLEIDSKRYFVTSALMNEWMDEMPGCPCGRGRATSYLKSLEDSRLQYFRSNAQRGFLWIGSASEDCPGHVTLDYVPPKKE